MPVTIPWHSTQEDVHHNNTLCTIAGRMDPIHRRGGTGGKQLCGECKQLDAAGK